MVFNIDIFSILFAVVTKANHTIIINYDKAVCTCIGDMHNLLLTDRSKFEDLRLYWWSSQGSPKWLRTGYEPKASLQGAGKELCCGCVQDPISIYGMRWLLVSALPHHELWA